MQPLKVLIADNNESFRKRLARILGAQERLEVIGEAKNGLETVSKATLLNPDIVFIEVLMPRLNGLDAAVAIKRRFPHMRIIITSHEEKTSHAIADLILLVDAYINKSTVEGDLPKYFQQLST